MKEKIQVVKTGLSDLDRAIGGLRGDDLVCLGSRPCMGKTSLALNIAANLTLSKKPQAVLFFSLELSKFDVMQRLIAARAEVGLSHLKEGMFPRQQWTDLTNAASVLSEAPLYIADTSGLSDAAICSMSRRWAATLRRKKETPGLIIIDHLQLIRCCIRCRKGTRSRKAEIAAIASQIKRLAQTINVPILLLSQVARRVGKKGTVDPRPELIDLRESGAVAQAADVVAFIYREGCYNQADPTLEGKAEIILAKNARGKTGTIPLKFVWEFGKFTGRGN